MTPGGMFYFQPIVFMYVNLGIGIGPIYAYIVRIVC